MQQIESIVPGSIWPGVLRARQEIARQDFAAARRNLDEAIAACPQELVLWIVLSHVLLKEGKDWPAAERVLRPVLELDPENVEAESNLAILDRRQPSHAQAG